MPGENEGADLGEITGQAPPEQPNEQAAPAPEGGTPPAEAGSEAPPGDQPTGEGEPERKPLPKWMKDRIDRATRQKGDAERERDAARAEATRAAEQTARLRALLEAEGKTIPDDAPAPTPTATVKPEDLERRASEIAEARVEQQRVAAESARVMSEGAKAFGADKWEQARQAFVEDFGAEAAQKPAFFDAIFGVENGHEVFYRLANDPDEAARVLSLSPARIGVEIARMAAKPKAERRASNAPAPIAPVNGGARPTPSVNDDSTSMDDFIRLREEQVAARRRG